MTADGAGVQVSRRAAARTLAVPNAAAAARAPAIAALQAVLAAEHAAVYGYGVVGAHMQGRRQRAAMRAWNAHRARRDHIIAMLSRRRAQPVVAAAAYQLPFRVTSPAKAAALAAAIEDGVTRAYLGLVALPDTGLRTYGALAMRESAVRAATWRHATMAFPGMPSRAGRLSG